MIQRKTIKGNRRIAREKVMQILLAQEVSEVPWQQNLVHIFPVEFRMDETEKQGRLLSNAEIAALEADTLIEWSDEDRKFAVALIEATLKHREIASELIQKYAENWDFDRIAMIDKIMMEVSVGELLEFNDIPPKVTINEAIEIVKRYSTEKSGTFVNGILDAILTELKSQGKIHKVGRGLLDQLPSRSHSK